MATPISAASNMAQPGAVPQQPLARMKTQLGALLQELGPKVSASVEIFNQTLRSCPGMWDELQLAEIIIVVLSRQIQQSSSGADDQLLKWNLDIAAEVLANECRNIPNLNWALIVQNLDHPNLVIRTEIDFQILARVFMRISGSTIPAAGLVSKLWSNRLTQLAILIFAANSHRSIIDFSPLLNAESRLLGEVPVPPNGSWMCLPLFSTLLELAAAGLSLEVLEAVTVASSMYPEYVVICLAQLQDTSGIRAEVLRRILPLFSGLSGSRPTSTVVMMKLQQVNVDLLVLIFRIAFKRCNSVADILDNDARLKSMGPIIARRVEEEGSVDELLGYWCVKADRTNFNLDEVCSAILERGPHLARTFVAFAKANADMLRPRATDGGLLSFESFATLLRAVQSYPSIVPIDDIRSLAAMVNKHQPMAAQPNQGQFSMPQGMHHQYNDFNMGAAQNDLINSNGANSYEGAYELSGGPQADDIEEEANGYFQKIYTSDISIADVINLLRRFKFSEKQREQDVFRCMIHNLFDEYRFFHKYPDKELTVTGKLFGSLIQHQLVSSITLGIALRYVLEALRKDPELGGSSEKMFRFGKISLEQFRQRLNEWPQYCSHLIQIPHLGRHCYDLLMDVQRAMNNPNLSNMSNPNLGIDNINGNSNAYILGGGDNLANGLSQYMGDLSVSDASRNGVMESSSMTSIESNFVSGQINSQGQSANGDDSSIQTSKYSDVIDKLTMINIEVVNSPMPSDNARDQIHFICNNIAASNVEAKSQELHGLLSEEYFNWFANYLVVKRITTQPNLHPLYLQILEYLDYPKLSKVILHSAYNSVTKLLQSSNIITSSSERSLLRNLGVWLGQVTLGRNKALLQRRINLKELLFWGYETGRLIAVCSFVAKIVEGCKDSKIFKPPNPWLMAVLGVMRELYDIEDLKMNIKFEVQVLCKNINIKIEDIPKTNCLASCKVPVKDVRNPDFNIKSNNLPSNPPSASHAPPASQPFPQHGGSLPNQPDQDDMSKRNGTALNTVEAQEQTVIPNLSTYVTISPSLQYFVQNPSQRRLVSLGIDRAIREIIQPVVERSVAIAAVSTKQLILKDYASEPNEQNFRAGAHMMVSNLAGSLALVTCKEPLRVSMGNHLRSLISLAITDQAAMEHIVQVCCNDNLDLGCMLIEKASMEKATRDIDEALASSFQGRRKLRESGQPLVDTTPTAANSRYPRELPDILKPRTGGLSPNQAQLYEAFAKVRAMANAAAAAAALAEGQSAEYHSSMIPGGQNHHQQQQQQQHHHHQSLSGSLDMSQSMQAYQQLLVRIDMSIKSIQVALQGREVSITVLGSDHEIVSLLREMVALTQRISPALRNDTAMAFCESIFKRMVENVAVCDLLYLEVMVGIIEALCEACGGVKKLFVDIFPWLSHYSAFNTNDENSRKMHLTMLILLLRAKLLRSQDADVYFATHMDGGRNMIWVELALTFVRQCLAESLVQTYEFSNTFETVSKMRPQNAAVRKQLQKWLTDLRSLAAAKDEQKMLQDRPGGAINFGDISAAKTQVNLAVVSSVDSSAEAQSGAARVDHAFRDVVMGLLERWLRAWTSINDQLFQQYLQLMHQFGVLKTEEIADRFFRTATDLCVEASLKSGVLASATAATSDATSGVPSVITHTVTDALSKLFVLLVRLADKEGSDVNVRINLLSRILNAIARSLLDDHETKKAKQVPFDQRPYYRLFLNLMIDIGVPDPKQPQKLDSVSSVLITYSQIYLALQPSLVPGFAFSWLQLITHKCFMPGMLLIKNEKGWPTMHRLLMSLLLFLQPFLKAAQLTDPIRKLFKAALRTMLVLLHDFPEFLSDHHISLCDAIPNSCVQLRNLVLTAYPRVLRLPDPFTPNLKIESLPEINQHARSLTDYVAILSERGLSPRIDAFLSSRQPADFPSLLLNTLCIRVSATEVTYNSAFFASVVMYISSQSISVVQSTKAAVHQTPAMDIFKHLATNLEPEGKYLLFNSMANQLRYPNSHTHFFFVVFLTLFAENEANEAIQETITRVLLERLIVHRPHPWGLLVTFIELIKNPRFNFWRKSFIHISPEIERVFESMKKSCIAAPAN